MDEDLRVGLLTIGNEVLDGLVLDTNAHWLEQQVLSLGLRVARQASVRDDLEEIGAALAFLEDVCSVVITSGGLGPTFDDMTLEAVARHYGLGVTEDPEALSIVRRQYRTLWERGIVDSPDITESRRKMARIPEGAVALDNRVGGAPGVRLETDRCVVFCLPGVPSELKSIFEASVRPWLESAAPLKYYQRIVLFPIRDETVFAPYIKRAMRRHPGVYIKSMPKTYGTSDVLQVWVSARCRTEEEARALVDGAILTLREESGLQESELAADSTDDHR